MSNATQNCLFVGGQLNDQAKDIADYVNEIFIPYEGSLLGLPNSVDGLESDYSRWKDTPLFLHADLTEDEFNTFLDNRGLLEESEDTEDDDDVEYIELENLTPFQAYVLGIRDMCDLVLTQPS